MKKKLFLSFAALSTMISVNAQTFFEEQNFSNSQPERLTEEKSRVKSTAILSDDSYYYWENNSRFTKELNTFLGTTGQADGGFDTLGLYTYTVKEKAANGGYWQKMLQGIPTKDTLTLNSITFVGSGLKTGGSSVTVKVYKKDLTTVLATKTLTVSNTYGYKTVTFDTPVTDFDTMLVSFEMASVADSFKIAKSHSQWNNYNFGTTNAPNVFTSALPFAGDAAIFAVSIGNNDNILGLIQQSFDFFVIPNVAYNLNSNFSASNLSFCLGDSVSFQNTANTFHAKNPILNYIEWDLLANNSPAAYTNFDFGDGNASVYSDLQESGIVYQTAGTFSVDASAMMLPWTATSLILDTKTFSVTVNALPVIAEGTFTNPSACGAADGSVVITGSGSGTLSWSGSATGSMNVTLPATLNTLTAGAYNFTFDNGCVSNTISRTLNDPGAPSTPTISANSTNGSTTVCAGDVVTLTSSETSGNLWSTGETTQSITVNASLSNITTTVTVNGCSATSAATNVTVNPIPNAPSISANGTTTFCEGGSVILTSTIPSGNLWSTGETTQTITVNSTSSVTATVTANSCVSAPSNTLNIVETPNPTAPTISANGPLGFCSGGSVVLTSSETSNNLWSNGESTNSITVTAAGVYTVTFSVGQCSATSTPITVTFTPSPNAPIITITGSTTFCEGGSVVLSSTSATGNLWSTGETTQSITVSSTLNNITTTFTSNGCTSLPSTPVNVTENPIPAVPTITAAGPLTFCNGNSVTLTSSAIGNNMWSNGESSNSITVTSSGVYFVENSVASCSSTSLDVTVVVNDCSALEEVSANEFTIFPNPSSDIVTLSNLTEGQVTLISTDGKIIESRIVTLGENETFNVSTLTSGVYFFQLNNKNGFSTSKLIVE